MTVRVGVIGGGMIAQAVHLPNLRRLSERFALVALADPSREVLDALASRYGPIGTHLDWRRMLETEALDAVVICSPNHTHADAILAALDLGLHVFVEKPLCIDPTDAETICRRRREVDRIVQVGYMKRFDPALESLIAARPVLDELRFVDAVTYDPWMAREPFVPTSAMAVGHDVPAEVVAAGRRSEAEQVEAATGRADAAEVRVFVDAYLGALIHDVNLVHGILDALGLVTPVIPVAASHALDAAAATVVIELPGGVRWHSAWMLLAGVEEFRETISLYFDGAVHQLRFPAPYFVDEPTVHEVRSASGGATHVARRTQHRNVYAAELEHFHACVVDGVPCRTPAEQGARDVELLRDLFLTASVVGAVARA